MKKTLLTLLFAFTLCMPVSWSYAAHPERTDTPSLHTHLTIGTDGTITVTQIFTNFSTSLYFYFRSAHTSNAPFSVDNDLPELVTAQIDGEKVPLSISGKETDPYVLFAPQSPGLHKYVLVYRTTKRILFEKHHDKLVWGMWGGPNNAKKECRASASVELPQGGVFQSYDAHLGHETFASKAVTKKISSRGWALFGGKDTMMPDEDMVLTVTWNKGVVTPDGSADIVSSFSLCMGAAFCAVLLCCLLLWYFFGRDPIPKTTIPLFYPPVFRGRLLSPGAVDYLRHAAELTSKGFSATLFNLAAQKALTIFGKGTRKEPYILTQTAEAGTEIVFQEGQSPRNLWSALLRARSGFDQAERSVINGLFQKKGLSLLKDVAAGSLLRLGENPEDSPTAGKSGPVAGMDYETLQEFDYQNRPCVVMNRKHSWELAMARDAAYVALADELRSLWRLRADIVSFMHVLAYVLMAAVLGVFYFSYGTGASWAATLTIMTVSGGLALLWYKINTRIHRVWMVWKEMGWLNLALYVLYIVLIPLSLLYDCIMDESFSSFPGYTFMYSWMEIRVLLILGLAIYLFWLTRKLSIVFLSPLVAMGFCCAIALPLGMLYYASSMPWPGAVFLLLALLLPTLFTPIMKQPTKECADILAEIQGFALYLGAAEASMHTVLNVPDKTPDEFRRGMPYAVALGLEKAWGAKFADLTGKLRMQGSAVASMAEYNHRMSGE